jgi:hypothetical protein
MVDGDVESAEAVTHTRIAVPKEDGSMSITHVLESLDLPSTSRSGPMQMQAQHVRDNVDDDNNDHMSRPQTPRPRKSRVCIILYFVNTNIIFTDTEGLHSGVCCSCRCPFASITMSGGTGRGR